MCFVVVSPISCESMVFSMFPCLCDLCLLVLANRIRIDPTQTRMALKHLQHKMGRALLLCDITTHHDSQIIQDKKGEKGKLNYIIQGYARTSLF